MSFLAGASSCETSYDAVYQSTATPGGTSELFFETGSVTTKSLELRLVAKDIPQVFGLKLNFEYNPSVLQLDASQLTDLWGAANNQAVNLVKETVTGKISIVMSHFGPVAADIKGQVQLGSLVFTLLRPGETEIELDDASSVFNASLQQIPITWIGGKVTVSKKS
jgi:hypothetical protein